MLDRLAFTVAVWLGISEKKLAMPEYPWPLKEGEKDVVGF